MKDSQSTALHPTFSHTTANASTTIKPDSAENETLEITEFNAVNFIRKPPRVINSLYLRKQNHNKQNTKIFFEEIHEYPDNLAPKANYDRTSFRYTSQNDWKYSQVKQQLELPQIVGIVPPAEKLVHLMMLHIIEVLNGQRPAKHLQMWMTPPAYHALVRRARLGQEICGGTAKCPSPQIRKVRIFQPTPQVAEASVVLFDGRKIRAAALRLEARRNRWHIAEIEVI